MASDLDYRTYPMPMTTTNDRGLAVIWYFTKFTGERKLNNLPRTKDDALKLQIRFEALHFEVTTEENLTEEKAQALLSTYSGIGGSANKKTYSAFVFCVLSHGSEHDFYTSDSKPMRPDHLTSCFESTKCEDLNGKPKLFFMQMCRGIKLDTGFAQSKPQCKVIPEPFVYVYGTALQADFLMVFSSPPGYKSFGKSKFVDELVTVLKRYTDPAKEYNEPLTTALLDMTREVSREKISVGKKNQKEDVYQVPWMSSTLTARLCFPRFTKLDKTAQKDKSSKTGSSGKPKRSGKSRPLGIQDGRPTRRTWRSLWCLPKTTAKSDGGSQTVCSNSISEVPGPSQPCDASSPDTVKVLVHQR